MASSSSLCLCLALFCSLVIFATPSMAKTSFKPDGLVLPVAKDAATLTYITSTKQRTPPVPIRLILDLGGDFLWVDCEKDYVSSTYKPSRCNSAQCKFANSDRCFKCHSSQRPGCHNNTCSLMPSETVLGTSGNDGQLGQDHVSLHSTDGMHPGKLVSIPNFLFICSQTYLLAKLPTAVKGFAGLGRDKIGIPSQFASAFGFSKKFALCFPSSTKSYGVVFFGPGPYVLLPGMDVSKSLTYTPFLLNPFTTAPAYVEGKPSAEYFINAMSIKMNGLTLPLNASLLVLDQNGHGGTKISTVNPYTVLESSIFNTLNWAFLKVLPASIPRLGYIAPYGQCFNSSHIGENDVPSIDLVLQSESVYWRLSRANSMVQVKKDVVCLAFVDAVQSPTSRTSIVIGGHQLEENLLQFDLVNKRFGFSSSLPSQKTSCSNFNFTSTA